MERSWLCCSGHVGVNKINEVIWTEAEKRCWISDFERAFCLNCCAVKMLKRLNIEPIRWINTKAGTNSVCCQMCLRVSGVNDVLCAIRLCSSSMKSLPLDMTKVQQLDILPVCCSQTHPPFWVSHSLWENRNKQPAERGKFVTSVKTLWLYTKSSYIYSGIVFSNTWWVSLEITCITAELTPLTKLKGPLTTH